MFNLLLILCCAAVLIMGYSGQPEEPRCGECTENPGCPAANTSVIYPCPYCVTEAFTQDAEIEVL